MTERKVLIEKLPLSQLLICLFHCLHKQVDDKDHERIDNTEYGDVILMIRMSVLMTITGKVMTTGMTKNASKILPTYHMFYYLKHGRPKAVGLIGLPKKKRVPPKRDF